ncbi:hypothetical protein HPB52_021769 [Rhipicephalus sanguineus]|uniref:gamma-glutamylcyclotransferase n=1 Tax=Rhipicephalus sanguineus TaxID=34632 RepID=A0A9D4PCL2_RHISA|nr:hypothetical protein HPB52_021769 [Rhipicephalus sanguineus]
MLAIFLILFEYDLREVLTRWVPAALGNVSQNPRIAGDDFDDQADSEPDDILYFAYASNMWSRRIHICNPTAKFLDIGEWRQRATTKAGRYRKAVIRKEAVCRTYIYGHTKAGKRGVPSLFYKAVIVAGAIEHKLPETYVQQLVKQPDNGNVQGVSVPLDVGELRSS